MRKAKKSLKDKIRRIYGTITTDKVPYVKAINGNADVLEDLVYEVECLKAKVEDLARVEFAFDKSAEIEEILNAEMERRMKE